MDFELTRSENDERLLSQIESIKTAENIQVLIPFAKAYLGMFYVIDKELAAKEKLKLLANSELAEAILSGFIASLNKKDLPAIENIGYAAADKKEFAVGYVILAGLDIIASKNLAASGELDIELIEKAVGFHFSNRSGHADIWFNYLLAEHQEKFIPALSKYWLAFLQNKGSYLPGRNFVLGDAPNVEIIQYCILLLLENWISCKVKTLSQLLLLAFKYADKDQFFIVCEKVLANDESLNERARLYWLTSAYLLAPEKYFAKLNSYVGRVKLKIMPLLDFIILIMKDKNASKPFFSDKIVVQLLRLIAPVFPPQHHIYGALGVLDINSKNVMLMFYHLACSNDANVANEIKVLRKARVMKIYSAVIDNLLALHIRKNNEESFIFPGFDTYVEKLVEEGCLQGRSNKFDLR